MNTSKVCISDAHQLAKRSGPPLPLHSSCTPSHPDTAIEGCLQSSSPGKEVRAFTVSAEFLTHSFIKKDGGMHGTPYLAKRPGPPPPLHSFCHSLNIKHRRACMTLLTRQRGQGLHRFCVALVSEPQQPCFPSPFFSGQLRCRVHYEARAIAAGV
eukprot:1159898-Pelagomonas_calceolata.AAC.5